MSNHITNTEMMEVLLENCQDKVSKQFLINWAYNISRKDLFPIYKQYMKKKKYYQYSKKKLSFTNVKGRITFDKLTFNFFIN